MKLWYTPTSCGAASFMAAFAGGLQLESEQARNEEGGRY